MLEGHLRDFKAAETAHLLTMASLNNNAYGPNEGIDFYTSNYVLNPLPLSEPLGPCKPEVDVKTHFSPQADKYYPEELPGMKKQPFSSGPARKFTFQLQVDPRDMFHPPVFWGRNEFDLNILYDASFNGSGPWYMRDRYQDGYVRGLRIPDPLKSTSETHISLGNPETRITVPPLNKDARDALTLVKRARRFETLGKLATGFGAVGAVVGLGMATYEDGKQLADNPKGYGVRFNSLPGLKSIPYLNKAGIGANAFLYLGNLLTGALAGGLVGHVGGRLGGNRAIGFINTGTIGALTGGTVGGMGGSFATDYGVKYIETFKSRQKTA